MLAAGLELRGAVPRKTIPSYVPAGKSGKVPIRRFDEGQFIKRSLFVGRIGETFVLGRDWKERSPQNEQNTPSLRVVSSLLRSTEVFMDKRRSSKASPSNGLKSIASFRRPVAESNRLPAQKH